MASIFDDEEADFDVVVNDEWQYSIWPTHLTVPAGWKKVGESGKKRECLEYVNKVWTDMRPRSLQEEMSSAAARSGD